MRILRSTLCLLIASLACLTSVRTTASNINSDADNFKVQESVNKKISTTLKIDDKTLKNNSGNSHEKARNNTEISKKPEQTSDAVSSVRHVLPSQKLETTTVKTSKTSSHQTSSIVVSKSHFHLGNNTRDNVTRKLTALINIKSPDSNKTSEDASEELPEAQELRYVRPDKRRIPCCRYTRRKLPSLNRRNVYSDPVRPSFTRLPKRPTDPKRGPSAKDCTFFTKTVCLEALDYPLEAIMRSIRSNKEMVTALLADYKMEEIGNSEDEVSNQFLTNYEESHENKYENRFKINELKRRSDYPFENVEEGFTCPSQIKYARPQLARAASGVWKYIINTGEHTQTLRLEKCSNTKSSCSFISENYRSSCVQIYNYHRLLTWDSKLGLHMDIFKVPTCCSCHVHGYTDLYPPHERDPPPKTESFPGADFATTDQKTDYDDVGKPSNYVNKYSPASYFDTPFKIYNDHSPTSSASEEGFSLTKSKTPIVDSSLNLSGYSIPGRRLKKPTSIPRPYDKLPQQHAPNTRAPGYTGSLTKNTRLNRPNRPFRRESTFDMEDPEGGHNATFVNRYGQLYDSEESSVTRKPNNHFDHDLHEPQTRINYNYHPIIDFFNPYASMLKAEAQTEKDKASSSETNSDLWKPIISS